MRPPNRPQLTVKSGKRVSPAPRSAPARVNSIAISACTEPSTQMKTTVRRTTSGSSIRNAASGRATAMIAVPNTIMTATERPIACQPLRAAPSGSPAPRCWPTRVAAAIEKPKPTTKENDSRLTPMP